MNQKTLLELLQEYACSPAIAMHMPGHKRNISAAAYLKTLCADLDITEIPGFSNLHDPEGALADRMKHAAALWGSKRAWWLIGGSTAGILAAIDAATVPGDQVLIARNCHKSVYNACELRQLDAAYIQPNRFSDQSFADRITPEQVESALSAHSQTKLVVLTSPTYEGLISDISAISEVVHTHGAVLMVDEAHGAHLGLHPAFPQSAITMGADIVVQSLHKTLPSLTQTAMIHLCSDRISADELGFRLSVYQTSSPSYLLMASIDGCVTLLEERRNELFAAWKGALDTFHRETVNLVHLSLPLNETTYADPSKLLISTRGTSITGPDLAEILRSTYQIETEMSTGDTVLAMTGMGDTEEHLLRLAAALNEIDATLTDTPSDAVIAMPIPEKMLPIHMATKAETRFVPIDTAAGCIAGDYLWAYPPGIPLIVPGEVITPALIHYIHVCNAQRVELHSPKLVPDGQLRVLKNP